MTWKILQGDVFDTLATIAPGSVDAVVTSPPYWQLRSYLPKGHELKRYELGSEPTPAEYIANQVRVFGLVRQAMADHAVCFVNIGDTYASGNCGGGTNGRTDGRLSRESDESKVLTARECLKQKPDSDIDAGNLCLIPQRLAIALQDDGWLVRSVIIWHKPAPMPASISGWAWRRCRVKVRNKPRSKWKHQQIGVKSMGGTERGDGHHVHREPEWSDCPGCPKCTPNGGYVLRRGSWRPTSSYEPVLMLAKNAKYFADGEPVKTPPASATVGRDKYTRVLDDADEQFSVKHDHETICAGANLRDVWTIAAEALAEKHYAAYPTELVARCLKAGCSERGYCSVCGGPWVRMVESAEQTEAVRSARRGTDGYQSGGLERGSRFGSETPGFIPESRTIGWRPCCQCNATPRPALVLDPFCGSGRTGVAARRLGLDFIGCELNPEYVDLANRQIESALRETKRPKTNNTGANLFTEEATL